MLKPYDKVPLKHTLRAMELVCTGIGVFAIFYSDFVADNRKTIIARMITVVLIFHFANYIRLVCQSKIALNINGSTFIIKEGDIFKQKGYKVINFNSFFDTKADDRIIAKGSLNGLFLTGHVKDVKKLDDRVRKELKEYELGISNSKKEGKKTEYRLGTILKYDDSYLITAFTRVDDNNRSHLDIKEYISFLFSFWDNLDKIYANKSVNITLFGGSSLTRFDDMEYVSEQELIEIIIWTFKISRIKFRYPTTITIVLDKNTAKKINLNKIKEQYRDVL